MAKAQPYTYRDGEGVVYSAKDVFAKPGGGVDWNAEWKKGDVHEPYKSEENI